VNHYHTYYTHHTYIIYNTYIYKGISTKEFMKQLMLDVDDTYWKEYKKICIDKDTSVKKAIERFIYLEVDKSITKKIDIEKEIENENVPNKP